MMSFSQIRVALVVSVGVIGASLLGATFVGCQSASSGPYGQYGQGPNGQGSNGQPGSMFGGMGSPGQNSMSQRDRQAFLNESQRVGGQQGLTPPDVVAMKRSGQSDQQIAMAISQRGAGMAADPNAAAYLAQNGVNPALLTAARPAGGMPPGMPPGMAGGMMPNGSVPGGMPGGMMASGSMPGGMPEGMPVGMPPGMQPPMGIGAPSGIPSSQFAANTGSGPINTAFNNSPSASMAPSTPEQGGPVQPAAFETQQPAGFGTAATAGAPPLGGSPVGGAPGQSWRPLAH